MESHCKRFPSLRTISDAKAFIGALRRTSGDIIEVRFHTYTYIILKASLFMVEPRDALPTGVDRCWFSTRRMVNIATSVLPCRGVSFNLQRDEKEHTAPVGAE